MMADALTAYLVPDVKDATKPVMVMAYGFKPEPNMGLAPIMTNGEPVPASALIVQTIGGITTVTVNTVQMVLLYGLTLAGQLWKG